MITGDWIGTDVIASGHTYPAGSVVGISDDDSPSVAADYGSPANASIHRWRVELPSLAGQLVKAGKDWRAYLENIPEAGTHIANWPGDNNTGNIYAVKHNPFPYVAEVQDDPSQFAKQVPYEQLFSDLNSKQVTDFSYIVPDQCRDMHGLGKPPKDSRKVAGAGSGARRYRLAGGARRIRTLGRLSERNAVKDDDASGGLPVGDERNERWLVATDNRAKFGTCKPAQNVDLKILMA